jgi:uncharacterized protein YkwD
MAANSDINLNAAKPLELNPNSTSHRGYLGTSSQNDIFRLQLNGRSSLNVQVKSQASKSRLQVIRDRNNNGQIDLGEIVSGRAQAGQDNALRINNASAGTYYLRVFNKSDKSSSYTLKVRAKQADKQNLELPASNLSGSFTDQVLTLTNNFRAANGLSPLKFNSQLMASAQAHAEDMALGDYFSHYSLDGRTPFDRIKSTGYRYTLAAENIAAGYGTPQEVVQGWINSPGHRANLLHTNLKEIGIGFYSLQPDTGKVNFERYWTQNFGTAAP